MTKIKVEVSGIYELGIPSPLFIALEVEGKRHVTADFRKTKDKNIIEVVTSVSTLEEDNGAVHNGAKKSAFNLFKEIEAEVVKFEKGYLSYTHIKANELKSLFHTQIK